VGVLSFVCAPIIPHPMCVAWQPHDNPTAAAAAAGQQYDYDQLIV